MLQDEQVVRDLGQKLYTDAYNIWITSCKQKKLSDCLFAELDKMADQYLRPWFDQEIASVEGI